jgi:hypothetical protein
MADEPSLAGRSIRDMTDQELTRHLDATIPAHVERAIRRELAARKEQT